MRTAAQTCVGKGPRRLQPDIQAPITWLDSRLPALDDDLDTTLRTSPVWREREELLRSVEQIYAELEAQWAEVIGAPHIQRMRRDLVRVLSGANGELPPVRPTW